MGTTVGNEAIILSLRRIDVVEETREAAMSWPRRRKGVGGGGEDSEVVFFFFWILKLDVAFVAELESRFQRESARVPWRNLFRKRGWTTQRLDFF